MSNQLNLVFGLYLSANFILTISVRAGEKATMRLKGAPCLCTSGDFGIFSIVLYWWYFTNRFIDSIFTFCDD